MERERTKQAHPVESEKIKVQVTIHGRYLQHPVELSVGATLADLLEEVKRVENLKNLSQFTEIIINGSTVELDEDGNLKENPILTQDSVLSLLKRFKGGNS